MKYVVTLKDKTYEVEVEQGEAMILDEYEVKAPAAPAPAAAPAAAAPAAAPAAAAAPAGATADGTPVTAPLPGNVLSIKVSQGAAVKEGDVLLLIEAMKMETKSPLRATAPSSRSLSPKARWSLPATPSSSSKGRLWKTHLISSCDCGKPPVSS